MPPDWAELKASWIPWRVRSTVARRSGSLTSQPFCGSRRMRAPLTPPRLSLPRKDEADAHAVETSSDTDRSDARIWALREAVSAASTSSYVRAGSGSCHTRVSAGTSGPR